MLTRTRLSSNLAVELRKMITLDLVPGSQLPSEKELAERFGVSRNTVREALLSLWDEGLVVRKWGVGTFVRELDQPVTHSLSTVIPMNELFDSPNLKITLVDISIKKVPCPADAAVALSVSTETEIWFIDRTFAFDGRPAFILQDWFPTMINRRNIDPTPLKNAGTGLLELLRDSARCKISRMEAQFSAIAASKEFASRLGTPVNTPLISVEQVSIDNSGEIAIFSRNFYHTSVSRLHLVRSTRDS